MRATPMRIMALGTCAALATCGLLLGVNISGDGDGRTVVAEFASAAPLVEGNQVKLDGVVVGEVLDMRVSGGVAHVAMQLDDEALPLHRDATFTIRPVSLLGERYVDLHRGSPSEPALAGGESVPVSQTDTNVGLDQILNTVDQPTGRSLAHLVTTLGEGMRGNGTQVRAALAALPEATRDVRAIGAVLRQHNALLDTVVAQVTPVARALADREGRTVDELVGSAHRLLAATRARDRALQATLARLPGTVRTARGTLAQLAATAAATTPTLASMRPVTSDLRAVSGELHRFAGALDPALAEAEPVLRRAEVLLERAGPVAASLRRASPGLRASAAHAAPLVNRLSADMDTVFDFIRNWALATNGHDGLSHYLRVNLIVNPDTLTGATGATRTPDTTIPGLPKTPVAPLPSAPTAPRTPRPSVPGTPDPTPSLPSAPDPATSPTPTPGGTLLQPQPSGKPAGEELGDRDRVGAVTGASATGLTYRQESHLVSFLLGGEA